MKNEYKMQELKAGDLVEFPENEEEYRYGIVTGGFGCSLVTMGSKIFGVFGSSPEEVKERWKLHLQEEEAEKKEMAEKGSVKIDMNNIPDWNGYTRRQKCRIVEHIEV